MVNQIHNELSAMTKKLNSLTNKLDTLETARPTSEPSEPTVVDLDTTPLNTSNRIETFNNVAISSGSQKEPSTQRPNTMRFNASPREEERNVPTPKGPILIIADSMMRGIRQTLLMRDGYVNKQIIHGGTAEAIDYINSMHDDTPYKQVVIHIGTNDINTKHKDNLMRDFEELVTMIRSKWESAQIIISGINEHRTDREKNRSIAELNSELEALCQSSPNMAFCNNSRLTRKAYKAEYQI